MSDHKKVPFLFLSADELADRALPKKAREREDVFAGPTDRIDPALDEHVQHFMRSVRETFTGRELSIDTPEQAEAAFDEIAALKIQVENHLKLARSLKQLLRAEEPEPLAAPTVH